MPASVRVYLSECNKLLLLQPVAVIIVVASAAWLPLYLFSIVAALVSDAACNRTSKCENDTEKALQLLANNEQQAIWAEKVV